MIIAEFGVPTASKTQKIPKYVNKRYKKDILGVLLKDTSFFVCALMCHIISLIM